MAFGHPPEPCCQAPGPPLYVSCYCCCIMPYYTGLVRTADTNGSCHPKPQMEAALEGRNCPAVPLHHLTMCHCLAGQASTGASCLKKLIPHGCVPTSPMLYPADAVTRPATVQPDLPTLSKDAAQGTPTPAMLHPAATTRRHLFHRAIAQPDLPTLSQGDAQRSKLDTPPASHQRRRKPTAMLHPAIAATSSCTTVKITTLAVAAATSFVPLYMYIKMLSLIPMPCVQVIVLRNNYN